MEQEKKEKRQITKNLETLVLENTNLKESLYEEKENVSRLNSDLDFRTKELTEYKNIIKKNQLLIKKLEEEKRAEVVIREQREKDYEEMKNKLEIEVQLNKSKKAELDAVKQERSSNNVLSLEVDNYEKSIEALKAKLSDETSKCVKLESTIVEQRQLITNFKTQLGELRDTCFAKTNQLTSLGDKNESLKSELCDSRQEVQQIVNEKQSLIEAMEVMKKNSDKLSKESILNSAENKKIALELENKIKYHAQQIDIFKCEITRLNDLLRSRDDEIEALKSEYEGYKLRAQSVLRTKQIQSKESSLYGQNITEIEAELNHLRTQASQQLEKLENLNETIKSMTTELAIVKEERDSARDSAREVGKKLSQLSHEYSSLRDQCRGQLGTIEKLEREYEEKKESLIADNSLKLEAINKKYQCEIENLQLEIEKLSAGKNDKIIESKYDSLQDSQLKNEIYLTEREDGEGSESVDSYTIGNYNLEKNYNKSQQQLMPLDELLNSSDDMIKPICQILPSKVDRHELELCERRVTHLTVLLADAERDAEKLNQMNQLLKEDIRRQQRSAEREEHANNFEYLKNVIIKVSMINLLCYINNLEKKKNSYILSV